MDAAIDLSDASKALDLANIRFQLMYVGPDPIGMPTPRRLAGPNCPPSHPCQIHTETNQ